MNKFNVFHSAQVQGSNGVWSQDKLLNIGNCDKGHIYVSKQLPSQQYKYYWVVCRDGSVRTLYMMVHRPGSEYQQSLYRKNIKISRNIYAADIILDTTGLATLDISGNFIFFEANNDEAPTKVLFNSANVSCLECSEPT